MGKTVLIPETGGRITKILLTFSEDLSKRRYASLFEKMLNPLIQAGGCDNDDFEIWVFMSRKFDLPPIMQSTLLYLSNRFAEDREQHWRKIRSDDKWNRKFLAVKKGLKKIARRKIKRKGQVEKWLHVFKSNLDFRTHYEDILRPQQWPNGDLDPFKHGRWVQDPFLVFALPGNTPGLLESYYVTGRRSLQTKYIDQFIGEQLSSQSSIVLKSIPFWFEGGNVLVGKGFVLFGRDILRKNWSRYVDRYSSYDEIEKAFRKFFFLDPDAHVFFPGLKGTPAEWQDVIAPPVYLAHLDMYITLGGKCEKTGKEIVMVAEFYTWNKGAGDFHPMDEEIEDSPNFYMKAIVDWFNEQKSIRFKVVRMPAWMRKKRKLVYFSYNNSITERYGDRRIAYVPDYRKNVKDQNSKVWRFQQERVVKAWQDAGFEKPHFLFASFHRLADERGSLHCMVKVLQRAE